MVFRRNLFFMIQLALGIIGAAWVLAGRYVIETENRRVEIVVDYSEAAAIAGAADLTASDALVRLKEAGATSVAIQERTVADLAALGALSVRPSADPQGGTIIIPTSVQIHDMLLSAGPPFVRENRLNMKSWAFHIDKEPEYVLLQPVGLPAEALDAARQADMPVVARVVNHPGLDNASIERTAEQLRIAGVRTVIFAADEVLGFRSGVDNVAEVFKSEGLVFGSVEFARQKGEQKFTERMMPNVVRVHSITSAEMGTLDRPTAVERLVKATKERNVRLVYVRMFDISGSEAFEENVDYVSSIVNRMASQGLGVGPSRTFDDPASPLPARLLMGLGIVAGLCLLFAFVWPFWRTEKTGTGSRPWMLFTGFGIVAALILALSMAALPLADKIAALAAAITFPIVAVLYAASGSPSEPDGKPLRSFAWHAVVRFVGVIMLSGAGGLIVAGLLSHREFMLKVDQFSGVKLAHVIPILTVAIIFAAGIGWSPGSWREQKERAIERIKRMWSQPMLVWQVTIGFLLLMMVAVLLARSGNEPGVGVSGLELRFRSILDTLLYVRPRTKEFLVGHPALFLGIAAALGGRRTWAGLLLIVGMIGEVSLVNTFCHIHTPIAVSIIRTAIGAALGLAIGVLLLLVFSRTNEKNRSELSIEDVDLEQAGVQQ